MLLKKKKHMFNIFYHFLKSFWQVEFEHVFGVSHDTQAMALHLTGEQRFPRWSNVEHISDWHVPHSYSTPLHCSSTAPADILAMGQYSQWSIVDSYVYLLFP